MTIKNNNTLFNTLYMRSVIKFLYKKRIKHLMWPSIWHEHILMVFHPWIIVTFTITLTQYTQWAWKKVTDSETSVSYLDIFLGKDDNGNLTTNKQQINLMILIFPLSIYLTYVTIYHHYESYGVYVYLFCSLCKSILYIRTTS